ncbi:DUF2971 domain-containing protein [Geomesophilobacter sediminis]|uniref:DUF2971 domain-containing protein n=1 Tax=Geomesophilobacter sediminis TaxID=2798584 RepID=A0A8J7JFB0_9BACT|nr:DUF2971 domain-containing protein [Geomesophilobacter sediminis]MBJ6724944.1 DUF2971 domain-containing protein [Geomesophilobacter sediminis]
MPQYLYRYRPFNQNALLELIHGELYFSSPASFNDPFDGNNMFSFDGATDDHWRTFLEKFSIRSYPDLSPEDRKERIDTIIRSGAHREKEFHALQQESWGRILTKLNEGYGVACLSSNPDDILMWSHYGGCHKGFCLIFDRAPLQQVFLCQEVTYSVTYPVFGEFVGQDFNGIAKSFLFTKSDHWAYESEYRLLVDPRTRADKPGDRLYPIPEGALLGVIFGCRMPQKDRLTIREVVSRKWPKILIFEAKKSLNSYSVEIEPIGKKEQGDGV